MDKTLGIVLAVYALILWILVFFVWHKGYREWKANRANRVREFRARVVGRRERSGGGQGEQAGPAPEYLVTFEFHGDQREFEVGPTIYEAVRIGHQGTLYLRGQQFETFEPKTEAEEAEDVYRRMLKD